MNSTGHSRVVVSHGVRIAFHARDPRLLASIGSSLPPGSRDAAPEHAGLAYSIEAVDDGRCYRARYGAAQKVLVRAAELQTVLDFLRVHLQHAVAENAVDHLFVHAGAVAWRGNAILLPGPSCSGKSELVRELISAGAVYLSDEFAAIDASGWVHPFPRPLSLRLPEGRRSYAASEFGAETGAGPLPVGLIAVTRYEPGGHFEPISITAGEALLELLANTVIARANPSRAVHVLKAAVSRAAAIRSPRGEAARAAREILKRADNPCPIPPALKGVI